MIQKPQNPPDAYLLGIASDILSKHELPEKLRVQTAVTLRRRFRGTGKSDRFGLFETTTGQWLGDDPAQQLMMDLYSLNIIKPIIIANQAAMVQARVECTIDPTCKKKEGVAAVSEGIYKYLNNHPDYWSNVLENQANQQIQTDYGVWIHTYFDPDADSLIKMKVDEYSDEPLEEPGSYACRCGAAGKLFSEMMGQATDEEVPCPNCGEMAIIIDLPSEGSVPSFKSTAEYPSGNTAMDVVSMFQIRVDERNTKSGNVRKARYLEHHFRMDEDDLQAMVPHFELGSAQDWSYPIKWEHYLETGNDCYLNTSSSRSADQYGAKAHEVRKIYVRPAMYRHYRSPSDFTLDRGDGQAATNREGRPMLNLKAGQGFMDAYPDGFFFLVDNNRLLPYIEPANLQDEWAYFGFINDAASTYHQPCAELNELQRSTNNLYTIDVQQRESASLNTTVYDSDFFEANDLEQQLAPTKSRIESGDDINKHVGVVAGVPSNAPMEGMNFIRSLVQDVSGQTPAALGRTQPGVAYASQALQREQSLGRLVPSQYSKAEAKACVTLQFVKHAQRNWPRERFDYIAMMYGDKWRDNDVDDFLKANLDLDISTKYKEDSVVPVSLIQQQLAFQQVITLVANAAKATGNPKLLSLELLNKYIQKMVPGEGIDIENVDSDERLADSRYRKIVTRLEQELHSGVSPAEAIQQALGSPDMMPLPRETHSVAIDFFMDHATALLAADNPNYPLLACLVEMIKRHEEATKAQTQQETADAIEGQAPALAIQKAAADMQGKAAAEGAQAKAQADAQAAQMKAQADAQLKQIELQKNSELAAQQQTFDREMKIREEEENAREREHVAEQAEAELALKAAELAAKHPDNTESHPLQKVGEAINFKDLPIGAKKGLLDQVGLPSEGLKDTQINKPATKPERRPLA